MPSLLMIAFLLAQASDDMVSLMPNESTLNAGVLSGAWELKDGEIIGRAEAGQTAWYRLPGEYQDFQFEVEFQMTAPANGGVQYRAHWLRQFIEGTPENSYAMHGYQANIAPGEPGRTGEILVQHGQPAISSPREGSERYLNTNKWNKLHLRVVGSTATIAINHVSFGEITDESFIGGNFCLQVQGGDSNSAEIRYRNARVKDLKRTGYWRPLFDGKSLDGWKIYGTEIFQVNNGVIECRRGPKESEGYLATEEEFTDFRVRGQFKMLGDGNYGLFYHSTITLRENDGYPVIAGVQGEVEPSFPGSTGWVYESYKRGWLIKPDPTAPAAALLRPGEWNEIEIRSIGNRLTTWVNGMRVIELLDPAQQLFSGSFALQLHTGEGAGVDWRELYVNSH